MIEATIIPPPAHYCTSSVSSPSMDEKIRSIVSELVKRNHKYRNIDECSVYVKRSVGSGSSLDSLSCDVGSDSSLDSLSRGVWPCSSFESVASDNGELWWDDGTSAVYNKNHTSDNTQVRLAILFFSLGLGKLPHGPHLTRGMVSSGPRADV